MPEGTKIQILAPIVKGKQGEYQSLFDELRQEGFVRVKVDGEVYNLDEDDIKNIAFNSKSDPKAEDYMIFHARGHVKEILASESSSGNIRDFNSGRYAGILDSNQKSYINTVLAKVYL